MDKKLFVDDNSFANEKLLFDEVLILDVIIIR